MTKTVIVIPTTRVPYAFLAKNPTCGLFDDFRAEIDWQPYTLDIPSYLGSAAVDTDGNVLHAERNAHQWRRVKYSYMDCRRRAETVGLVVRGPRHIFDSTVAHVGMLYAQRKRVFKGIMTQPSNASGNASSILKTHRSLRASCPAAPM